MMNWLIYLLVDAATGLLFLFLFARFLAKDLDKRNKILFYGGGTILWVACGLLLKAIF